MKKRFFAGLLACLMVVGLLPLSMLLKPVSAKAAAGKTYVFNTEKIGENPHHEQIVDNFFEIYNWDSSKKVTKAGYATKINTTDTKESWGDCFKFGATSVVADNGVPSNFYIKFVTSASANIDIKWTMNSKKGPRYIAIVNEKGDTVAKQEVTSNKAAREIKCKLESAGTYYVICLEGDVVIYNMEVVEESASKPVVEPTVKPVEKTSYSVVVNSSNGKKNETVEDGAKIDLTTDTTNFLYWINSNGKIVSRKANDTITVYYEDEYTAVYEEEAVVKYMTAYGKVYKSVPVSQFNVNEKVAGPVRYGYNFTDWKTSASDIKKSIDNNEKVIIVEPGYESADKSFKVTIDTTALTNGTKENKTPKINEVVKASTDSSEFAYWVDDNNNVLSYNSTYYFFANRNINVKAVKKTADVSPKGVISLVDKGTNEAGDSVVIFEYTIPSTCTVKFAGVVASPTKDKLTRSTAEYVGGDAFSGSTTYRYTITKTKGMDTWYVLPVLEYVDGTQVKSVLWNTPVEF